MQHYFIQALKSKWLFWRMVAIAIVVVAVLLLLLEIIRSYREMMDLLRYLISHRISSIIVCCLIGLASAILWGIYIVREEEAIRNRETYKNKLEDIVSKLRDPDPDGK